MDEVILASGIVVALGSFILGAVCHKYVFSEAEAFKLHVSGALTEVRDDIKNMFAQIAKKL